MRPRRDQRSLPRALVGDEPAHRGVAGALGEQDAVGNGSRDVDRALAGRPDQHVGRVLARMAESHAGEFDEPDQTGDYAVHGNVALVGGYPSPPIALEVLLSGEAPVID